MTLLNFTAVSAFPHFNLSRSAWLMTKFHRAGGLKNRHLFLTGLNSRKSKIKVPANWIVDEGLFPGFQTGTFSLRPHMTESWVSFPLLTRVRIP